jgi:putative ABC transport system substrate-binding protein
MRRRDFLEIVGAVVAWPFAARAQQTSMPVIGLLHSLSRAEAEGNVTVFRQALAESGYVEGQNVAIEYRWAEGRYEQLQTLATELVKRGVSVIVAFSPPAAAAAKAATATIPVVFSSGLDPVKAGFVASLNRPGGNVTGVFNFASDLGAKRLGLLAELVPAPAVIAALINPANPDAAAETQEVQDAAEQLGRRLLIASASTDAAIEAAFAAMVSQGAGALHVGTGSFYNDRRVFLSVLASRNRIPTIYQWREFAAAGGLMSYGTSLTESFRQVGIYASRILQGAKPAELPVVQMTKFELVINLKTAKTLGLSIPPTMLARVDEVIE